MNTLEFIERSNLIHNNKYDYTLVEYINSRIKIKIICPDHGIFEQIPNNHLSKGYGCAKCVGRKRLTKLEFIDLSNLKHKHKYDYSMVDYKNNKYPVKINCPTHGEFLQSPKSHMKGHGCNICGGSNRKSLSDFIEQSNVIHSGRYDYSLVEYKNAKTKVKIICPEHGIFEQTPSNHIINKYGCLYCNKSKGENFIQKLLDKLDIYYEREKRFEKCRNIKPLPFDFFIPTLNVCIEFNGLQHYESVGYWGGDLGLTDYIMRDNIKEKFCIENDIKLLKIKYDDNIEEKIREII